MNKKVINIYMAMLAHKNFAPDHFILGEENRSYFAKQKLRELMTETKR